jgi:DNA polymerase III delta prime subunit
VGLLDMHAYLFIGNNKENIDQDIKKHFGDILDKTSTQTMTKIEDVRNLRKLLKLSQSNLVYIRIDDIDSATTEAQNAFLKNLEEPPNNVIFLLTGESETNILPTILSRCQLIKSQNSFMYSEKEISDFFEKGVSEKIISIGKIQKKDEAIKFITEVIFFLHDILRNSKTSKINLLESLKVAEKTLSNLKSNGNVFLQLINFAIRSDQKRFIINKL